MYLFRNPIVWLRRFRKRCGYGIHSPFAFHFVTGVLYEHTSYYAYGKLDKGLRWWEHGRRRSFLHLLFRLANFSHPTIIYVAGIDNDEKKYILAGSKNAHFIEYYRDEKVDMVFVSRPDDSVLSFLSKDCMIVAKDINKYPLWWLTIHEDARVSVSFDLWDIGIAFCRTDLNHQNYKVNW